MRPRATATPRPRAGRRAADRARRARARARPGSSTVLLAEAVEESLREQLRHPVQRLLAILALRLGVGARQEALRLVQLVRVALHLAPVARARGQLERETQLVFEREHDRRQARRRDPD